MYVPLDGHVRNFCRSYRLKNTRTLANLLLPDHGCDALSPGIGDIAFVNDLRAERVVTTNFECSVFGPNSGSVLKIGWVCTETSFSYIIWLHHLATSLNHF
jgi:hypothetical protein